MADENRRAGDWQRKDLRQHANDLAGDPDSRKWYDQTFWIVFFLLALWPMGVVLVWRGGWPLVAKALATALVAAAVYFSWTMSQAVSRM